VCHGNCIEAENLIMAGSWKGMVFAVCICDACALGRQLAGGCWSAVSTHLFAGLQAHGKAHPVQLLHSSCGVVGCRCCCCCC
jgi:hypothetical protein